MAEHIGATILGCVGPVLAPRERAFFRDAAPWGFVLFARNVENPAQLARLCADLRMAVGREAPVFIDQEGGRVQRMGPPHWRQWLPPLEQMERAGTGAARAAWLRYRIIAAELRGCGIDGNFAPVTDVAAPETHEFLRNRCLGQDAASVVWAARAAAEALLAGGVLPVIKHLPGHGRAQADSHAQLPVVHATRAELEASDFAAVQALADLPLGMTAHVVFAALDPEAPATCSATVLAYLRRSIGFDGLLMSDDISMGALSGTVAARSEAAMAAGCDLVLHCNGDMVEMGAVAAAAGGLSAAGARRAQAALGWRKPPQDVDIPALEAELEAILSGRRDG